MALPLGNILLVSRQLRRHSEAREARTRNPEVMCSEFRNFVIPGSRDAWPGTT